MKTNIGLPPEQRTMHTDDRVEPIPGMEVCDFCACTPVVHAYECGLVIFDVGDAAAHASSDPWAACEHCRALIDADDRAGLAERALGAFIAENGEQPNGVLSELRASFAQVHATFFAARVMPDA